MTGHSDSLSDSGHSGIYSYFSDSGHSDSDSDYSDSHRDSGHLDNYSDYSDSHRDSGHSNYSDSDYDSAPMKVSGDNVGLNIFYLRLYLWTLRRYITMFYLLYLQFRYLISKVCKRKLHSIYTHDLQFSQINLVPVTTLWHLERSIIIIYFL